APLSCHHFLTASLEEAGPTLHRRASLPQLHAGTSRPRHQSVLAVFHVTFDVPEIRPGPDDSCLGDQLPLSHGAEEVDLQLHGRKRLAFGERASIGVAHRRIRQIAVNAAVQRATGEQGKDWTHSCDVLSVSESWWGSRSSRT